MSEEQQTRRCGFVAIIGAPNAGKSTLMNHLVGTKVSIVSARVQTTRTMVRGIALHGESQVIFIDTPGIFKPKRRLDKAMVAAAWQGGVEADVIMVVVDAARPDPVSESEDILRQIAARQDQKPVILVLNKVDKIRKEKLLDLSVALNDRMDFAATFMISALKGSGIDDLLRDLADRMPLSPWHFPEDQVSDMPMRLLAAEITREKLFQKLYQELPQSLTVETEAWEHFKDGSVKINQIIYVMRDSQKSIVLGKGGAQIKSVGETARHELEDILETRVHLKLFVKVREGWAEDPDMFRQWGLDTKA